MDGLNSLTDFQFLSLFCKHLGTIPSAPITIGSSITFMFHCFYSFLAKYKYLSVFWLLGLVFWVGLGDLFMHHISFLVFWSICLTSSFVHFKKGLMYHTRGTAKVFISLKRFLLQSLASKVFSTVVY